MDPTDLLSFRRVLVGDPTVVRNERTTIQYAGTLKIRQTTLRPMHPTATPDPHKTARSSPNVMGSVEPTTAVMFQPNAYSKTMLHCECTCKQTLLMFD